MTGETSFYLGIGVSSCYDGKGALEFIASVMEQHDISHITAIGTLKKQSEPPFVVELSSAFKTQLKRFSASELEQETPRLKNPSRSVYETVGCHGVAEAAAFALGGEKAKLIIEKTKFSGMTLAIVKVTEK